MICPFVDLENCLERILGKTNSLERIFQRQELKLQREYLIVWYPPYLQVKK
jgi:hypothetical protein